MLGAEDAQSHSDGESESLPGIEKSWGENVSLNLLLDDRRTDDERLVRQLTVVGNGLDLYCGLVSRFADFFWPRKKLLESVEHSALHGVAGWEDSLINHGLTAWDNEALLDKLLEELHALEGEFAKYMLSTVEHAESYQERYCRVFHGVVVDELEERRIQSLETSILNFNYTIPSEFIRNEVFGLIDHYVNVHGSLRNEIVIGIDATGHMDEPGVAQFTKTYRVMGLASSAVGGACPFWASCGFWTEDHSDEVLWPLAE